MRKEGKWAAIRDLRVVILHSYLWDTPTLGPNDKFVFVGDKLKGPCLPSPLVLVIVMVRFGLPWVHFVSGWVTRPYFSHIGTYKPHADIASYGYHWEWSY